MLITKTLSIKDLEDSGLLSELIHEFYFGSSYYTKVHAYEAIGAMIERGLFSFGDFKLDEILNHIDIDTEKDELAAQSLHLINTIIEYVPPNVYDIISYLTDYDETNQGFKTIALCGNGEFSFRATSEAATCLISIIKRANTNQINVMVCDQENSKITMTALLAFCSLEDNGLVREALSAILRLFEETGKCGVQRQRDLWQWFCEVNGPSAIEEVQYEREEDPVIQEMIERIQSLWEN